MKKLMISISLLVMTAALYGCAGTGELIRKGSEGSRSDIFVELADGGDIPAGHADLRIASSLKTHKPGIYPMEKKSHGTPDYRLLVNIDGQAVWLAGSLKDESIEQGSLRDPEAGDGIRYRFSKGIRLRAGTHKVIVAIPEDGIAVERDITLTDGSSNSLVLEPLYGATAGKQRPGFYGVTSFMQGLKGFRMVLNGKPL